MVNQQLLEYIKQQLQQGIGRDQIKNSLMSNGWQPQDIEEGFNTISQSLPVEQNSVSLVKPATAMWKIIVVSLVGIVIIGGGIYFASQKFLKEQSLELYSEPTNQQEGTSAQTKNEPGEITQPQIIDCGIVTNFQNFDCFVNAAKNCSLSKVTNSTQIDLFGMTTQGTAFYEIKGQQEGRCMFYLKTISSNVIFSQELTQKMLSSGATNEQIKQQEQKSSKIAQSMVGRDGTCGFTNTNDLVDLLNKWKGGNFSTEDFKDIDCKGEYFGQGEQLANTSKTITDQECNAQKGHTTAVIDAGTACFKNQIDLGTIVGSLKMNGKYPQCCTSK